MTKLELFERAIKARTSTAGDNTQYAIYDDGRTVYLSIEGSCDNDDWRYNFDFAIYPYKHMGEMWRVHKGFATAWKLARDQIRKDVETACGLHIPTVTASRRLVILGFSHGAALAVLAHEFFSYNGYAPETHVFGCPPLIWFPTKSIRVRFSSLTVHQVRGDIVTSISKVAGYRDVGTVIEYGPAKFPSHLQHTLAKYREALA